MKYDDVIIRLKKDIDKVLGNYVLKAVQKVEQEAIDEIVYSVYEPGSRNTDNPHYIRRKNNGGLRDSRNMIGNVEDGILTVTNITPPNSVYETSMPSNAMLAELIEYGSGYKGYKYDWPVPRQVYGRRPFTRSTVFRLYKGKQHIMALKSGLKDFGYNIT